ncbi:MAG: UbiA family prenyltransferase, partial [candidate division WOR-3 bacterium]
INPKIALIYGFLLCILGLLGILYFSFKAFILDLIAIVSYSFVYTFLKRKTPFSIIIGSIPGALPTSIGYVAMKNEVDIIAFSLFSLMFLWQPSHFIYLSLFLKDDYKNAKIPTISVKYSYEYNKILSFLYSFSIIPITIAIYYIANLSISFLILVLFLNIIWITINFTYWKNIINEKIMFISSNFYVLFIFSLIALDKIIIHKP